MPESTAQKTFIPIVVITFCLFFSFSFYAIYTWNSRDSLDLHNKVVDSVNQSLSGKVVQVNGNTITLEKFGDQKVIKLAANTLISKTSKYELIPYDMQESTGTKYTKTPPISPTIIPDQSTNNGMLKASDIKVGDFVYVTIEVKDGVKNVSSVTIAEMETAQ